jgi:hypothetical protein
MKKNGKQETRHLVASADATLTICSRPIGKVLLWAKKGEPGEKDTVCGRCKALKAGRARTEKIAAKHEAIRKAGKNSPETVARNVKHITDVIESAKKNAKPVGKRQPALLVLGDKMPKTIEVNFKGNRTVASVNPNGTIVVPDGQYYQTFNSPSRAGKHVAGREVDGWTFWSTLLGDGSLVKLDALRKAVA